MPTNTGIITTGNNPAYLRPGLRSIWGDIYKGWDPIWSQIFKEEPMEYAYEIDQQQSGFSIAEKKREGDSLIYVKDKQGYQVVSNQQSYGLGFIVTQEEFKYNRYMKEGAKRTKYLANAMQKRQEYDAAQIFNDAFSTTGPTGAYADGVALISNAHPVGSGTASNLISTAADLSEISLEEMLTNISSARDNTGIPLMLRPKILMVGPAMQYEAMRLLNSEGMPGTANNDTNVLRDANLRIVVNPYLTDPDAFFLITDAERAFVKYNGWDPEFDQDGDFDTKNKKFSATMNYVFQKIDWRGVFGSPGI